MKDDRDLQGRLQDIVDDHFGVTETTPADKLCDIIDSRLGEIRIEQAQLVRGLRNEMALWRNLSRMQDKLLTAYRLQKSPAEYVLNNITKYRKALEPFVQAAVLRGED